jgi:D-alanyl-D-alanine carboxypeptidase
MTALVAPGSTSAFAADDSSAADADRALDRALERFVERDGGPPGIAVVVQRGRRPVLHAAGTAVLDTDTPATLDDHVRLASVAKAYSGAAALAAVADGKLRLRDTIGEIRPDLPEQWSEVTLRQLMQHTGGVPDFSQSEAFAEAFGANLLNPPAPIELLSFVADEPLEFEPGSRYDYSNSDNIIIGLMLEKATGTPYEQVLRDEVFGPFGLDETSLPSDNLMPPPFVHGYAGTAGESTDLEDVTEDFAAGWTWASGGIVATPRDANRFVRSYVAGRETNASTRDRQRRFRTGSSEPPGPGRNAVGLSLFRYRTRCGTVYGHSGNTLGYTAFVAASGRGTRSVAVSVNRQLTPDIDPANFEQLRRIFGLAVCAAMADA